MRKTKLKTSGIFGWDLECAFKVLSLEPNTVIVMSTGDYHPSPEHIEQLREQLADTLQRAGVNVPVIVVGGGADIWSMSYEQHKRFMELYHGGEKRK